MEDLTLITCSYNTPAVTITMLKSFFAHHGPTRVIVCDNSTDNATSDLLELNGVPHFRNRGGVHIKSVDLLFDAVQTKYALLVDTDIIFLENGAPLFEKLKAADISLLGEVCGDRGGKKIHNRVHPWYCFVNVADVKRHNIRFYNPDKQFSKSDKIYDVGCTFFSDLRDKGLKIGDLNATIARKYYTHYEGMSWRTKRFGTTDGDIDFDGDATHTNRGLYEYGLAVEQIYDTQIEQYKDQQINAL